MKKMMIAISTIAMLAGSAFAADLPANKVKVVSQKELAVAVANDSHWYVGGNVGFNYLDNVSIEDSQKSVGATLGYQYTRNLAAELAFTHFAQTDGLADDGQALMVNGIVLLPTSTAVTPYALAGVGAGFNGLSDDGNTQPIYNLGLGARVALNESWDVDARYTHVNAWDDPVEKDSVTVGVAFKF